MQFSLEAPGFSQGDYASGSCYSKLKLLFPINRPQLPLMEATL